MKKDENNIKINLEKLEEEIENKKKLPESEKKLILKKCISNVIILLIILIYLFCLQIGEQNIQTEDYMKILKVFSIILIIGTIVMFEISYRINKNDIILHSIEILILSFFTLFLIYGYSLYYGYFYKITISGIIISAIYYIFKCILIIIKSKKKYHKSQNDIKSIVEK